MATNISTRMPIRGLNVVLASSFKMFVAPRRARCLLKPVGSQNSWSAASFMGASRGCAFSTSRDGDGGSKRVDQDNQDEVDDGVASAPALYDKWRMKFMAEGVPEPFLSTKYLLGHALDNPDITFIEMVLKSGKFEGMEFMLNKEQLEKFESYCERRLKREPVQYIVGHWDFRNIRLNLRQPVLIPRNETEELVGFAYDSAMYLLHDGNIPYREENTDLLTPAATEKAKKFRFLEVGCGSGCVSLGITSIIPHIRCVAIDKAPEAIALTKENTELNGLSDRVEVQHVEIEAFSINPEEKFDMLVSNPPYVTPKEMEGLQPEVKDYEDSDALNGGGEDGLNCVRAILERAKNLVKPGCSIWLEVNGSQPKHIKEWVNQNADDLHLDFVAFFKDIRGVPRFCHLKVQK
eukprot:Nk52_evm15s1810 gene=Nk52_evmTU15s1810